MDCWEDVWEGYVLAQVKNVCLGAPDLIRSSFSSFGGVILLDFCFYDEDIVTILRFICSFFFSLIRPLV